MRKNTLYEQFHIIFEQHYNPLCNYALTFVKSEQASEDIVQEVFMKIWENGENIIRADGIRYYLFTAVRNNSLTYLRKAGKHPVVALTDEDVVEEQLLFSGEVIKEVDYRAALNNAISTLPPKCRDVFIMSRVSKLSYQQIATSQGISIKTVENQIGKALKMLRAFAKSIHFWMLLEIFALINW
ncbi:RNA polymerase sigma-70 factor (ECF subfamily) [Chitinophaga niastensis]|uniref:RNA polymerase sigma-70 factor (ECF subfamily) n=1 Tax=Chitinophaga niastensis TaxID=536980 RepID=A0A2P8HDK9_CHINA|nr:RNA polymerase sigma-70 factor [Chitinophaga niastensis]PSL44282.1 RNA polymerase sigma-70 factor (ECF subfamily) [Chitinophaga niastensis]